MKDTLDKCNKIFSKILSNKGIRYPEIEVEAIEGDTTGYLDQFGNITISDKLIGDEIIQTIAHEMGHLYFCEDIVSFAINDTSKHHLIGLLGFLCRELNNSLSHHKVVDFVSKLKISNSIFYCLRKPNMKDLHELRKEFNTKEEKRINELAFHLTCADYILSSKDEQFDYSAYNFNLIDDSKELILFVGQKINEKDQQLIKIKEYFSKWKFDFELIKIVET